MISHKHRTIFVHIPKTAGKSIITLFGLPEFGRDYGGERYWIEDPYDHEPIVKYLDQPRLREYFSFAVVRNPYDRLVSAFYYLVAGGANELDRQFATENLASFNECFRTFVLDGLQDLVGYKHFLPQTYWVGAADRSVAVDRLIRFERIDCHLTDVATRIGMKFDRLPRLNSTQRGPWQTYFDSKMKRRVFEVYEEDFRLFDYTS